MRKLFVHLRDYKKEVILAPLFKGLEASFELLVPIVMKLIIDVGIGNSDKEYILKMCYILIILGIVGLVTSITAQFYSAKAAVGFASSIRQHLFEHIQSLGFSEIDTLGTSTMITRMTSDVNQIQSGLNLVLRLFMRSPFIVVGSVIMAFTIDAGAALIFVVAIPILFAIVLGIMIKSIPLYKKVQGYLDRILNLTRENLTGVRVIRAFHKEEEEINTFKEGNENLTNMQLFVGKILAFMNPVTYIIVNGAILLILWVGGIKVNNSLLTTGAVIALVNYMSQILVELIKLANLIITLTKAVACANRVAAILEVTPGMDYNENGIILNNANTPENIPFITFKNVSLNYSTSEEKALANINLEIYKGETIGIIGGTGSGKSSLVNLIPRFYDVTQGELLIQGKNIKEYNLAGLRNRIGIVMQKAVLFKGTIKDNLKWGNELATLEDIEEALSISQSKEFVSQKDKGIDSFIEQGGKNLSGGQRQRLTIARAIVRRPEILILDDSASALDYATDAKLRSAIKNMKERPTVFIVSQRTSSIQYADRIVVLDNGNVMGTGTHEELLKNCEVYKEIYYSQYSGNESA
ncbi:MAG: ATP-binding cassette, subfamily bacterial [Anaerocolumna sp.]|jgi:ABC-type multidrug transport system fused ATPase/permease subunit|nr:ATP-binding cassette, subfamily bacterial [Anaerocolumna sp.]